MAKRFMYVRIDYDPIWVNDHGAAVEMGMLAMETLIATQLTQCHPLDEMKVKVQVTNHETKPQSQVFDPFRGYY